MSTNPAGTNENIYTCPRCRGWTDEIQQILKMAFYDNHHVVLLGKVIAAKTAVGEARRRKMKAVAIRELELARDRCKLDARAHQAEWDEVKQISECSCNNSTGLPADK